MTKRQGDEETRIQADKEDKETKRQGDKKTPLPLKPKRRAEPKICEGRREKKKVCGENGFSKEFKENLVFASKHFERRRMTCIAN